MEIIKKYSMDNKSTYIQISTTLAKKVDAERLAKTLSKKNLSACTQIIGPITSVYRWKGKLEKTKEWLCVIKTKRAFFKLTELAIKDVHPYELPEIAAVPIIEGSREYLEWIRKEL
jgi:periplasmic divalent cation tolerance protein